MKDFLSKIFAKGAAASAVAAVGLAVMLGVLVSSAPATVHQGDDVPRRLKMLVQNQTPFTLNLVDSGSLHSNSGPIWPDNTGEAKANAGGNVTGHATYSTPPYPNPDFPTDCSVTLHFEYTYNANKQVCKDQQFTLVSNSQNCAIHRRGTCGGEGNCDCTFYVNLSS